MQKKFTINVKAVFVGDVNVGKTSITQRIAQNGFSERYVPTLGADLLSATQECAGREVRVDLWDTAGQEKFRALGNLYYKNADLVVLVYDRTKPSSMHSVLSEWLVEVSTFCDPAQTRLLILANKSDASDAEDTGVAALRQQIAERSDVEIRDIDEGIETGNSAQFQTVFANVSAKTNLLLAESFWAAVRHVVECNTQRRHEINTERDLGRTMIIDQAPALNVKDRHCC